MESWRYDMYMCRVATSVVFVSPYPTQTYGTLFYHRSYRITLDSSSQDVYD